MASYPQITIAPEEIQESLENDGGLTKLVETVVNKVLQAEMSEHLQARPRERTDQRRGYRNGSYTRELTTRIGTLELEVPRDRKGRFQSELFERYQRSEKALVTTLMEMVVQGVSTRKVKKITTKLCGRRFTKSTVSKLTKDLDQQVTAWAERPLEDSYPFLVVDAMHVKVRRQQAVRSSTVMLVVGISGEGYREILGLKCCYGETGSCYRELFEDLKDRGLTGVELITSDSHEGLKEAIFDAFPGVVWNRCHAHFSRNVLDRTPSDYAERMHELLDRILQARSPERAREVFSAHYQEMVDQAGRALKTLESGLEEVIAGLALPGKYRRRLRTTNMLERFIEEIRRREKVIRIFPNMDSCWRLIGALVAERHEEWSTGRKYLDMTEYWDWKTTAERNQTPAKDESKLPAVPA